MGKFGKGILNNNAKNLLESNLVLRNALCKHNVAHRTTLTSLRWVQQENLTDGTVCHNPCRNQIDYIICKNIRKAQVQDSRLPSGASTPADKIATIIIIIMWERIKEHIPCHKQHLELAISNWTGFHNKSPCWIIHNLWHL